MDGDRRVITALFADLVDYVRMVAEHDPEEVRARVVAALESMDGAIQRFGGTREKFIGDAIFAVFGWPQAHDEDAIRAALAGLAIRAALRTPDDGGPALEVRIGIATGEVVAAPGDSGQRDAALTGEAVARAARIQSIARPGEILIDGATLAVARHRLHTEDRGEVVLRGQSVPVRIHALTREVGLETWGPPRSTGRRPLIGRVAERARLVSAIEESAATGRGRVVVVGGDAGIGKSRLIADVEPEARRAGFAWTWTENSSYGSGEPFRYARHFAQALADEHGVDSGTFAREMLFTPDLDPAVARRYGGSIAAIARAAGFDGWEAEARDLPVDPDSVAETLLEVGARYIDRIIETGGPRVIVIDDLHWLDDSSVGLVERIVERASRLPILVLAGSRPGQVPAWAEGSGVERIDLTGRCPDPRSHGSPGPQARRERTGRSGSSRPRPRGNSPRWWAAPGRRRTGFSGSSPPMGSSASSAIRSS